MKTVLLLFHMETVLSYRESSTDNQNMKKLDSTEENTDDPTQRYL